MTIDYTKCRETKVGTIILPKGRMVYPALLQKSLPKGEKDPAKAKYQVTVLIPKSADLSLLQAKVQAAIDERWTPAQQAKLKNSEGKSKIKKPFLKTADSKLSAYADEYPVMIRLNANYKPTVVGPDAKTPVNDEEFIYGGRWAAISCNVYAYEHETGGPGVSCGLSNAQLLDDDEMIGGGRVAAEDEFEAAEGAGAAGGSAESVFD